MDLQNILSGVNKMDNGFRELVDLGGTELEQVDSFIADNRENVYALLGNLTTLSQLLYLRVPALENLWRPDHESLVDRLSSTVHDGGIWVLADLYPKYRCDYNLPASHHRRPISPRPTATPTATTTIRRC